jgi:hypothetical protein
MLKRALERLEINAVTPNGRPAITSLQQISATLVGEPIDHRDNTLYVVPLFRSSVLQALAAPCIGHGPANEKRRRQYAD